MFYKMFAQDVFKLLVFKTSYYCLFKFYNYNNLNSMIYIKSTLKVQSTSVPKKEALRTQTILNKHEIEL